MGVNFDYSKSRNPELTEIFENIDDAITATLGGVPDNLVTNTTGNAAGANNVITSSGANKSVKDSGVAIGNIPTMAANGSAGNLLQTAAANKAVSDAGVAVANVVANATGNAAGANNVITSAAADKTVKDSGIAIGNLPTMAAAGGAGELVQTAAGDKALSKSGVVAANVVSNATGAAAGADNLITSAGADKTVKDSGVAVANVPTMAAVGGAGELLQTAAADKAISKSGVVAANTPQMAAVGGAGNLLQTAAADRAISDAGVAVANVVTNATGNAAGADNIVTSAGADKTVKDSGVAVANVPTMAAVGGAGELLQTAAADKAVSKSGVVAANVVTNATGNAAAGDNVVVSAGADKTVKDGGVALANIPTMAAVGGIGEFLLTAAADKAISKSGVTAASFATAAQGTKADNAVVASGANTLIRGQITLGGYTPAFVNFSGADVAATLLGSVDSATFALAVGNTFIVDPDGAGDVTWTVAGTQGNSVSAAAPATDMSLEADTKFKIAVDGGVATEVTCDWATGDGGGPCNDGTKVAAEIQEKVQALGGAFAAVTCDYNVSTAGKYHFKSGTYGTGSSVVITPATAGNCTEELKIGTADGGAEAAGTGDAANLAAATIDECVTALAALVGLTATKYTTGGVNKIRITSDTAGAGSSLVVNAASTLDTVFGITGSGYGAKSLGLAADMANTNYAVMVNAVKDGAGVTDAYSIGNKATTGFRIYCETPASTDTVDLLIFGTPA